MLAEDRVLIAEMYPALQRIAAVAAPTEVDANDLVHEALVRTLRSRSLVELDAPLAYLRRVIVNLASNERRSLARRRRAYDRLGAGSEFSPSYPSDLADLLALPPRERALLFLVVLEGLSYEEAAAELGMTSKGARQLAYRARRRLRAALEGADG